MTLPFLWRKEGSTVSGPAAGPVPSDLCQSSLQTLIVAWGAVMLCLWLLLGSRPRDSALTVVTFALSLALVLPILLAARHPRLAALTLITGAAIATIAISVINGNPIFLVFLSVLIVISAALLTPMATIPATAAMIGTILLKGPGGELTTWLSLLYAATGLSTWAAFRPQYSLFKLAWQRSMDTIRTAEQLRDKQGELNRTIKALDLAYQLLEKTNRDLALAQREADTLRDLRNRFATNLSHELRTPLNIVLGFANLIYRNPQLYGFEQWHEVLLRDLAQIQRNARYLSQLVDDVVDLARIDALAMPVRREMTSLRQVIDEAVEAIATVARNKGLEVVVACPSALPDLLIDQVRIRQVLFNLLSNAVRFTDQGRIAVEVAQQEGEVLVSVRDSGRGIPTDELSTIFDEFHQVGRPKTGPDAGKGLGLAIAKHFVQLHGGRIWAESVLGKGSVFHFTIPCSGVTPARLKQPAPLPLPKRRQAPTVAVVSRDDAAALYLSRRMEGYSFVHCVSPEGLASMPVEPRPIAILSDGTGGASADLRKALPTNLANLPVINCPLPNMNWISGDGGFTSVLTKPVTPDKLLAVLDDILATCERQARLLVVDDDRGFVQLISRTLQASSRNYQIERAYSGEEALRKMQRWAPSCVLLDLMMPEMSGFQVAATMARDDSLKEIPIIAITAATPGEDQLASEGAAFSFSKTGPFRPGELTAFLSTAFRVASGELIPPGNDPQP